MNRKTTHARLQTLADSLGNHHRSAAISVPTVHNILPPVMSFLSWIDPPIGVNMSGIDTANPSYKVRVMVISSASGGLLILPFAEAFAWNPMSAPPIRLQYQLTSALPNDPTGKEYYETMTLTQSAPGQPDGPESSFRGSPSDAVWQSGAHEHGHFRQSLDHPGKRSRRLDQRHENRVLPALYPCGWRCPISSSSNPGEGRR